VILEVRILNELRAYFAEVRILKELGDIWHMRRRLLSCAEQGFPGLRQSVEAEKKGAEALSGGGRRLAADLKRYTRQIIAYEYQLAKYYTGNG
jgi:hypothetical protein